MNIKIYKKSNGAIIGQNRVDTKSPYVVPSGIVSALGWDCIEANLSAFVGEEVCVEFISSDCGLGCHFGYGYIDGICSMGGNNINVTLNANLQYCGNQPISVDVDGVGYNQYKWTISKIDASGNEYDKYTGSLQNGFDADISDVKKLYEDNSNFILTCPQKIKVKLEAFSGCGSGNSEIVFDYLCPEYDIDYCNPFYYCVGANTNQIQIQGVNDCENCTYTWSSPQGLSGMVNTTSKFPVLDRSLNINAFTKLYNVEIVTPEGCKYKDSVKGYSGSLEINITDIIYGYCAYKVIGNLTFEIPVNIDDVTVIVKNTLNNQAIPFTISGIGKVYNFEFSVSRSTPSLARIEVGYMVVDCAQGNCFKYIDLPLVKAPLHSQWKVYVPTVLRYAEGQKFKLQFRSVNENKIDCDDINWTNSSVNSYRLEIYHENGNLLFDKTISIDVLETQGILGDEIEWDGTFMGVYVGNGAYTWKATIQSCYDGSNQCSDCFIPAVNDKFHICGTSGFEILTGVITL